MIMKALTSHKITEMLTRILGLNDNFIYSTVSVLFTPLSLHCLDTITLRQTLALYTLGGNCGTVHLPQSSIDIRFNTCSAIISSQVVEY